MANDAAREAAAALAPAMLEELVDKVPLPPSAGEDVLAADIQALRAAAEPNVVSSSLAQTVDAQAEAVQTEPAAEEEDFAVPTFEANLTDEWQELLDEPDFTEEADLEVEASLDDDAVSDDEYVDPQVAKKLKALEKKVAWQEQQLLRTNRKKWVGEAKRAFPDLARYAPEELEAIDASSRRGFAREAAKRNEKFAKIAAPLIADIQKKRAQLATEVRQEERQVVRDAWGEPTIGPSNVAVAASAAASDLVAARKSGQLHKVINVLFNQDKV